MASSLTFGLSTYLCAILVPKLVALSLLSDAYSSNC
jgi:hypothetical protein